MRFMILVKATKDTEAGVMPEDDKLMTAEECAALTVRAMERRQRLLIMNWRGRFGRLVRIFAPGLVDRLALKSVREGR